jgi:5'-nucleotidase/UDP-sugar diphosphatase
MQKDFKIGLVIGITLAAGAVIWLATLPGLSARARALEAASNASPSPKTPPYVSPTVSLPQSTDGTQTSRSIENQTPGIENPDTNNEPRVTSDESRTRIHVIQKGDTLSSISAKYYGSANQWRKILTANLNNLPDPNRLTPGLKLLIPQ